MSIKDHFSTIPKPKKEEKKEVNLFPLFIKKPKVAKENIATPPLVKKNKTWPLPKVVKEVSTTTIPFHNVIKADAQNFFLTQKKARSKQEEPSLPPVPIQQHGMDIKSIEQFMNENYPRWRKEPCCTCLYQNMSSTTVNNNKQLWCEKYRPNQVNGLLGYLPDFEYLRDWLERLKINNKESSPRKKNLELDENDQVFNLVLFVGDHGSGKTATAYTAAKETGYSVFEINSTSKRTGKKVIQKVGEMTESHLVRFDYQAALQRRKRPGETIIVRDTVKKKKKCMDISAHFKKAVTVTQKEMVEVEKVTTIEEVVVTTIMEAPAAAPAAPTTPPQSLVLLEEVDILFEEDKGFWSSVIELCQKSKRPIIMTCNDETQIPFDQLNIQSIIYFDLPEKYSLLPYLQLVCFSEQCQVEPHDLEFLCELYNYDTRKLIDTLQLWLKSTSQVSYLFARVMGFVDLLLLQDVAELLLMERLKGLNEKTIELCIQYYFTTIEKKEKVMEITHISKMMDTIGFTDAWIGLTDKQRHQIYDIDQYKDNQKDNVISNSHFIYKNPTDLDHWELGETIEKSIYSLMIQHNSDSRHWEDLCHQRKDSYNEYIRITSPILLLPEHHVMNNFVFMMEYMPTIRSLCKYDQGIAGKGRTERSRRKIRYINLDDESRDVIIQQQRK